MVGGEPGDREDALSALPPSSKLVVKVLEVEGAHTMSELVECTGLPERTAREAVRRLADEGLIRAEIRDETRVYAL